MQQAPSAGANKRPHGLLTAIHTDQAKEQNADVHGEVEEHGRHATDKDTRSDRCDVRVGEDLKGKGERHDDICHDDVLQVDDEVRFAGNSEEDPRCQAIQRQA